MFIQMLSANPYIPWDTGMFLTAIGNLRGIIGTAFNVGIWIFIIIAGIVLLRSILDHFGG